MRTNTSAGLKASLQECFYTWILWKRGITGKGVTIAALEVTNLAHPSDWQVYPGCKNPGQNGAEIKAALDVEWASAAAPDANIELAACR
jgi:subtilase family serine protease